MAQTAGAWFVSLEHLPVTPEAKSSSPVAPRNSLPLGRQHLWNLAVGTHFDGRYIPDLFFLHGSLNRTATRECRPSIA